MADQRFESGVLRDLVDETAAIGELAKSEEAFRAAIAAFQSADRTAFQAVLEKLQLTVHCRLFASGSDPSSACSCASGSVVFPSRLTNRRTRVHSQRLSHDSAKTRRRFVSWQRSLKRATPRPSSTSSPHTSWDHSATCSVTGSVMCGTTSCAGGSATSTSRSHRISRSSSCRRLVPSAACSNTRRRSTRPSRRPRRATPRSWRG